MIGIFFDLDGTLVDSEPQHWEAWRHALAGLDVDLQWHTYKSEAVGYTDAEVFDRLTTREGCRLPAGLRSATVRAKKEFFCKIAHGRPLISDHNASLVRAVATEYATALVTSSSRIEALAVLEHCGLAREFRALVCLDDVVRPKPAPDPYRLAMQTLRVRRGVAFEDSKAGCASAAAAGLMVRQVASPSTLSQVVEQTLATLRSA